MNCPRLEILKLIIRVYEGSFALVFKFFINIFFVILIVYSASNIEASENVKKMISKLRSKDRQEKLLVIEKLSLMGENAKDAIPDLLKNLDDRDEDICNAISETLLKIGSPKQGQISFLIKELENKNENIRYHAILLLSKTSPPSDSIPSIIKMCNDPSAQKFVKDALSKIDNNSIPVLISHLENNDDKILECVLKPLVRIGSAAIPYLESAIDDDRYRLSAIIALGEMGSLAKNLVPKLLDIVRLDSNDYQTRIASAYALYNINYFSKEMLPVLIQIIKDRDSEISHFAKYAMCTIGEEAIPTLKEALLSEKDEYVIGNIEEVLNRIMTGGAKL